MNSRSHVVPLVLALGLAAWGTAQASDCTGNCGTSGANGVVSLPPSGADSYNWISTRLGQDGAGQIAGYGGTNGSSLVSDPFYAAAGSKVGFWFNYVTSDGAGFADYAWAQLRGAATTTLFTARTKPSGTIVPGVDLPGVTAILAPAAVPIVPGAPNWAPLGPWSGRCYAAGCGYTGWVQSSYTIADSGTYRLAFGVTNWADKIWDSGLAFQGLVVNGSTIGDGSSPQSPLQPSEVAPDGGFHFAFTPTPAQPVFIDPWIAVGYDYKITAGSNTILSAVFPVLAGDPDGYQIYKLGDLSPSGLLGSVLGGQTWTFAGGVTGFSVAGIDPAALLDPSNPTAFVTGLTFATADAVSMSQTPVSVFVPVPEASSWLMLLAGLGALVGPVRRARKGEPVAAG